ncbi:NADH-quinone oxidoreductase subunit NuoE [Acidiphilium sp. PA]|uniref:NADH-quinone oxidoreductase subunit NuoE n=1 Tax=Acidiphilium sp. PA TaxID=2871705 RepID=UPI0022444237|nr:NADH-quinone oxidoreductase subunit NuoE [Acidiphilium sp. PA]MCW8306639.1 NADH-quinone oxidoreductase subunit NuoE [Acidiphilium sp. PA]
MSIVETQPPLDPAERTEIRNLLRHSPTARAAAIDALKLVQQRRRYIADDILTEIAHLLGLPVAELDGIATFYNLIYRKPVGQTVILLCDSITCWITGRDHLAQHIERRIGIKPGETSTDGRFTLLPIVCLGHCDHAPAMMANDVLHGDVDPATLDAMFDTTPLP